MGSFQSFLGSSTRDGLLLRQAQMPPLLLVDSRGSLYVHVRLQIAAQALALGQSTIHVISGWIARHSVSVAPPIFTYDSTLYFGISAKLFDLKIAPQRTLHWHLINDAIKTTITASPRPARGKRSCQGTSNHPLYILLAKLLELSHIQKWF